MPILLPCPFCGSKVVFREKGHSCWFQCESHPCGARAGTSLTITGAGQKWNMRVAPSAPAPILPAPAPNAPTAASGPVAGFLEHLHEADRDDSAVRGQ